MNNHRDATRKNIVTRVNCFQQRPGEPFFPSFLFSEGEEQKDIWCVSIHGQEGMQSERLFASLFLRSQAEANEILEACPVGSEFDSIVKHAWMGREAKRREFFETMLDAGFAPGTANAGDEESSLAFDTLNEAGLLRGCSISLAVSDFLGKQRIGTLKENHGENWSAAAVFEYCLLNLPPSSPAYLAAAHRFHWYITGDGFKAGYFWRDLEFVSIGVEAEAAKAIEMRRKAGEKGRQASTKARTKRIESLLSGMEGIAQRNPDIAKLGSNSLAALGLEKAIEADSSLWRQGRGQVDEYLGEMRRGEAGSGVQKRFLALFPPKSG